MWRRSFSRGWVTLALIPVLLNAACEVTPNPDPDGSSAYNNTTDRTNQNAKYVGAGACQACHPSLGVHGHAHQLTPVQGVAPTFPEGGTRAGVPDPPEGLDWSQVSYVIDGYIRKAQFIDLDGDVYTDGTLGVNTQWNLLFPPNGTEPGFAAFEPDREPDDPKPFDYLSFARHTTGAMPQDANNPLFQENRPGFAGTWQEAGVQCEACHGPGSNHVPNPQARDIYVNSSAQFCGECHTRPFDSDGSVIMASGGYVRDYQQYSELMASGGHSAFACTVCHNPHASTNYDPDNALRNGCTTCHANQGMARHAGKTFVRGDYVEDLSCESCHMPYASRGASSASEAIVGAAGRMGDTRTHIFRINAEPTDYKAMFNEDMTEVVKDESGQAAVTVDFVCIRCHNGVGNAFPLTIDSAGAIAGEIHNLGQ